MTAVSARLVTSAQRPKAAEPKPQPRAIRQLTTVPAAPPSGRRLETHEPDRLSRSARRWLRPGSAAVSDGVCTHRPASHSTVRSPSWSGLGWVRAWAMGRHDVPATRGSASVSTAAAAAVPRASRSPGPHILVMVPTVACHPLPAHQG